MQNIEERYNQCHEVSTRLYNEKEEVKRRLYKVMDKGEKADGRLKSKLMGEVKAISQKLDSAENDRKRVWNERAKEEVMTKENQAKCDLKDGLDFTKAKALLEVLSKRVIRFRNLHASAKDSIILAFPSDFDHRQIGVCPMCLDIMPSFKFNKDEEDAVTFLPCCGSWPCCDCTHQFIECVKREVLDQAALGGGRDPAGRYQCPYCREPLPVTPKEAGKALLSQSANGQSQSQHLLANFHLGRYIGRYEEGHHINAIVTRPAHVLGVNLLIKAANSKYPPACALLGMFHLEGFEEDEGILFRQSVPKALQILHTVEDSGDPQVFSMLLVADAYNRDGNKYKHWVYLKMAAEAGHAEDAGKIGRMYLSCKDKGQRDNAEKYLRLAAEEGSESIRGKYGFYLANLYRDKGDIANYISALDAAAKYHAEASYVLGSYCLTNKYVELDRGKARIYLNQAAEMGHTVAKEVMELRGLSETEFDEDTPSTVRM